MQPPPAPVNPQFPQNVVPPPPPVTIGGGLIPPLPSVTRLSPGLEYLRQFKQFLVRRSDKAPCSYLTSQPIDRRDPQHWTDYETAAAAAASFGPGWGVGFALTDSDPVGCLDLDHCRNRQTGEITPLAEALIEMLPGAYVEVSVSGTGLHVWFSYSVMPPHGQKVAGVGELYHNWYIALGTPYEAPGFINGNVAADLTAKLPTLIGMFFPPRANSDDTGDGEWTTVPCPESYGVPADDADLLRLAMKSIRPLSADDAFGGAKQKISVSFEDMWTENVEVLSQAWPASGRKDGLPYDASDVDNALAGELAYFTGCNCERIERIMLSNSVLRRDKWDEPRAIYGTWLRMTIANAVRRKNRVYGDTRAAAALGATVGAGALGAAYVPAATVVEMAAIAAQNPNTDEAIAIMMQLGTQDSIAAGFATLYGDKLKFDHSRKKWHIWDGSRWREDNKKRVFDLAVKFCRQNNPMGKSTIGSASFARGVEEIAASRPNIAVSGDEWDRDNYLLNTPAGTIDLRTRLMRAHDPADLITKCTAAAPGTVSDGATFQKFMLEATNGDAELVRFHQVLWALASPEPLRITICCFGQARAATVRTLWATLRKRQWATMRAPFAHPL